MMRHGYHVVQMRPWPLAASVGSFAAVVGMVQWFHGGGLFVMGVGVVLLVWVIIGW